RTTSYFGSSKSRSTCTSRMSSSTQKRIAFPESANISASCAWPQPVLPFQYRPVEIRLTRTFTSPNAQAVSHETQLNSSIDFPTGAEFRAKPPGEFAHHGIHVIWPQRAMDGKACATRDFDLCAFEEP